nr:putative reverse transcriptase domain-containing protein [Tanacetum cinerariifolium]
MELQERSGVHLGKRISVSEEASATLHIKRTLNKCRILSLADKAPLMREDCNNPLFQKYLSDEPLAISLDEVHIDDKLRFVKEPLEVMDREVKRLKQSCIPIIKVQWNFRRGLEFTWEREYQFRKKHPQLFTSNTPSTNAAS